MGRLHTTWHPGRRGGVAQSGHFARLRHMTSCRATNNDRPRRRRRARQSGRSRRHHPIPRPTSLGACGHAVSSFTVGALVLRHDVEHAAVRLYRGCRRPSPSISRGRLRRRCPSPGPREHLGVDLRERVRGSGHPVRARLLRLPHGSWRPPWLTSERTPHRPAVVVARDRGLTLRLYLERFKGYFQFILREVRLTWYTWSHDLDSSPRPPSGGGLAPDAPATGHRRGEGG